MLRKSDRVLDRAPPVRRDRGSGQDDSLVARKFIRCLSEIVLSCIGYAVNIRSVPYTVEIEFKDLIFRKHRSVLDQQRKNDILKLPKHGSVAAQIQVFHKLLCYGAGARHRHIRMQAAPESAEHTFRQDPFVAVEFRILACNEYLPYFRRDRAERSVMDPLPADRVQI